MFARSTDRQAGDVAAALRALGYEVWRDDQLPAHRAYSDVIEERLRATQEELVALRRSYAHLLDRLYPSNEVYVVARAV